MGIRQKLREQPRLGTALVALVALALLAAGAAVMLGGGDGQSPELTAELEREEVERFEAEAEAEAAAQASTTQATVRATTTTEARVRPTQTTVPSSTAPTPGEGFDDEPIAEVTTTQPGPTTTTTVATGPTRIIRELTSPVQVYAEPALNAAVVGELGIAAPVEVLERKDGWYRIESETASGWAFGAFIVPAPDPELQAVISIDGSPLQPQYADGDLVPDLYQPGKYGFGFVQTDGARTLIYLPDGLVVYVPTNSVRLVE